MAKPGFWKQTDGRIIEKIINALDLQFGTWYLVLVIYYSYLNAFTGFSHAAFKV
jgi:hypothetical protein